VFVAEDPEHSDPLEKGVKTLGELLNQVKDEQEYVAHMGSGTQRRADPDIGTLL
jgi:hypothetical protein